MPGDICTGFTDARQKIPAGDEIYGGRISRSVAGMEKDERTGMAPEAAGRFVGKVALRTSHKPLYTIGFVYRCCVLLLRAAPGEDFQLACWKTLCKIRKMRYNAMEETIRQIFVDELGCEVAALTPECRLREDLGVSSLEMLGVVLALEDQFSITIDEADLPGIATFQDVVAYIRAHT